MGKGKCEDRGSWVIENNLFMSVSVSQICRQKLLLATRVGRVRDLKVNSG